MVADHPLLAQGNHRLRTPVAYGALPTATVPPEDPNGDDATAKPAPRHWYWARLMRRTFEIDVLDSNDDVESSPLSGLPRSWPFVKPLLLAHVFGSSS